MKTYLTILLLVLSISLALSLPGAALAAGGSSDTPYVAPVTSDLAKAKQAIEEKKWDQAIELLNKAKARDGNNAEIYNLLGYSERNRGNLDVAFKYYERALTLNPKHRGAHEYMGETYLLANNLAKAEEHLATLQKLCSGMCEEYSDLKAAIAAYKQKMGK